MVKVVIKTGPRDASTPNSVPPSGAGPPKTPNSAATPDQNDPTKIKSGSSMTTTTTSDPSTSGSTSRTSTNAPSSSTSSYSSSVIKAGSSKGGKMDGHATTSASSTSSTTASVSTIAAEGIIISKQGRRRTDDPSEASLKGSRDMNENLAYFSNHAILLPVDYGQLSLKNRKIISTNVRHFLVLFWILLFAQGTLLLGYLSIVHRLLLMESERIAAWSMSPFLFPCVGSSIGFSIVHIVLSHFKVAKRRSRIIHTLYLVSFWAMVLLDIIVIIITGTELYLTLDGLEGNMKTILKRSRNYDVMSSEFHVTQNVKKCCGVHGHQDWQAISDREREELLMNGWTNLPTEHYPSSCCPKPEDDMIVSCSREKLWSTGCYDGERHWITTYCGWYIALCGVGFILHVLTGIQIRRIFKYCKLYKPHLIMSEKRRDVETVEITENLGDS